MTGYAAFANPVGSYSSDLSPAFTNEEVQELTSEGNKLRDAIFDRIFASLPEDTRATKASFEVKEYIGAKVSLGKTGLLDAAAGISFALFGSYSVDAKAGSSSDDYRIKIEAGIKLAIEYDLAVLLDFLNVSGDLYSISWVKGMEFKDNRHLAQFLCNLLICNARVIKRHVDTAVSSLEITADVLKQLGRFSGFTEVIDKILKIRDESELREIYEKDLRHGVARMLQISTGAVKLNRIERNPIGLLFVFNYRDKDGNLKTFTHPIDGAVVTAVQPTLFRLLCNADYYPDAKTLRFYEADKQAWSITAKMGIEDKLQVKVEGRREWGMTYFSLFSIDTYEKTGSFAQASVPISPAEPFASKTSAFSGHLGRYEFTVEKKEDEGVITYEIFIGLKLEAKVVGEKKGEYLKELEKLSQDITTKGLTWFDNQANRDLLANGVIKKLSANEDTSKDNLKLGIKIVFGAKPVSIYSIAEVHKAVSSKGLPSWVVAEGSAKFSIEEEL
ncbi:MAG: hypothetical protein JNL64_01830 [Blastocatellia bacterium]|nr:hypothetical protein [Blastocatellia bacterium]